MRSDGLAVDDVGGARDGAIGLGASGDGASVGSMREIGGSNVDAFNALIARQVTGALYVKPQSEEDRLAKATAALAALVSIAPRSELEGMLAAQMVACHNAAMECFRRAAHPEQQSEVRGENLAQAARLSRAYAALVEALDRRRGEGGSKTVTVEHRVIRGDSGLDVNPVARIAAPGVPAPHASAPQKRTPHTRGAPRKGNGHAPNGHLAAGGATLPRSLEADEAALPCAGGSRL